MYKKIMKAICIVMGIVMLGNAVAYAQGMNYKKNETVFVVLDHDGKPVDQRVVNWIYDVEDSSEITDFGQYKSISNMKCNIQPNIKGDKIIWPKDALIDGDLFYEGITDKKLPVDFVIEYYLDGQKVSATDLAGQSGKLKIVINVENKLQIDEPINYQNHEGKQVSKKDEYYVPLLVQVSYTADSNVFSKINAPDANSVAIGEDMNLNFAVFPYPDAEVTWEMIGSDIELEPISIVVMPQMPPITDMDELDGFTELLDGVQDMGEGFSSLKEGSDKIGDGTGELKDETRHLVDGIQSMATGCSPLDKAGKDLVEGMGSGIEGLGQMENGAGKLSSGLQQVCSGIDTFNDSIEEFSLGLHKLDQGAAQLGNGSSDLAKGLQGLKGSHDQLIDMANALVAQYPEDSELHKLGRAILAEGQIINTLAGAGISMDKGINELQSGIKNLKGGWEMQVVPGFKESGTALNKLCSASQDLAQGLKAYKEGQTTFHSYLQQYVQGVSWMNQALGELGQNIKGMPSGIEKLWDAQNKLGEGIDKLNGTGILEMEKELEEAVDEINFMKAKKDKIEELAQNYRSFIDNENNLSSQVQFVMQTEKVAKQEIESGADVKTQPEATGKKTFWQRVLELFKR
jgi:putative membrane protein